MKKFIFTLLALVSIQVNAAQQPVPCSAKEYRHFDFWIGEWEVFNPQGQKVGENTIEKILNGCSLKESWQSTTGYRGYSFNIYDQTSRQWHQTWVDIGGNLLQLDGGLKDNAMVMTGVTQRQNGEVMNRITWTPTKEDNQTHVRQVWETSSDSGKTWQTAFDGLYKKKPNREE